MLSSIISVKLSILSLGPKWRSMPGVPFAREIVGTPAAHFLSGLFCRPRSAWAQGGVALFRHRRRAFWGVSCEHGQAEARGDV